MALKKAYISLRDGDYYVPMFFNHIFYLQRINFQSLLSNMTPALAKLISVPESVQGCLGPALPQILGQNSLHLAVIFHSFVFITFSLFVEAGSSSFLIFDFAFIWFLNQKPIQNAAFPLSSTRTDISNLFFSKCSPSGVSKKVNPSEVFSSS